MQSSEISTNLSNYDIKIRNIRFLGELTKFAVVKGASEKMVENFKWCLDSF